VNNFMAVSFTQALLIFTITQIILYLLMLMTVDKKADIPSGEFSRHRSSYILVNSLDKISFTFSSIGLTLTLLTNFRETTPYFIILSLVLLTSTLYIILRGPSGLILGSLTLWHLTMYLGKIPAIDIAVGEGSGMVREMRLNDHWDFRWAHNPAYNPIPTVAFIQATLSRITTMNWYDYNLGSIVFLAILIMYDLAIYILTYTVTRDSRIALLSIPLVAITPETPIHQHPYQWSGNALILIATALLISIIRGERLHINSMAIIFLFTGAILAHATGISYIFILTTLLIMKFVSRYLRNKEKIIKSFDTKWVTHILGALILILIIRSIYTHDYFINIYPVFENAIQGLIDLFKEFFIPSEEFGGAIHIPLYERVGVPWIQAYVWSYALSIATAYILYSLIKNRINLIEFALYFTPAIFTSFTFIGYGLLKIQGFYGMNRTTYVFIPLIYPLVAKTLFKLFEGATHISTKTHLVIALLGLMLFAIAAPIASQDPNISPIQYAKARQSDVVPLDISDVKEARFILILGERKIYYTYSYAVYKIGAYRLSSIPEERAVGIWYPVFTTRLASAVGLYSFLNKLQAPDMEVLTYNEWLYFNSDSDLIFNSQRNYVFIK
jgi:hypothetical protein